MPVRKTKAHLWHESNGRRIKYGLNDTTGAQRTKTGKQKKALQKSEPFYWRCYILIHLLRSNLAERFPPV